MYRLFCGYKTIYAPINHDFEYFKQKNIESITCYSNDSLDDLISKSLKLNDKEFFDFYNLDEYHFKNKNYQIKSNI